MTNPQKAKPGAATAGQIGAELAECARALGAELYGVASAADYVREFPDKPSPARFVEAAQSVIIIGLPFEPGTVATVLRPELAGLRAQASDQVTTSAKVQPAGAERFFLGEENGILARELALMGYKVAGVREPREGALRRYVQQKYEESFPEFSDVKIFRSDAFPRDLYRCFHENRMLGTGLDVERIRSSKQKTIQVEMFGKQREFLTGTVHVALRCGATIMTGFMVCQPYYHFHFLVSPPLADPSTAKDTPETRV